jgi:Holliday junction DNA helicase RuvA
VISYVKGPLVEILDDMVVIESGNIGLEIRVPLYVMERLPGIGKEAKLYTYFQVREDGMFLYGFLSRQDLRVFRQLITVTGVGPKVALGVLSALTPDELRRAIIMEDAKTITTAPGIGPKTAKRIILDLKDKVDMTDILPQESAEAESVQASGSGVGKEAVDALVALGYSAAEAGRAVGRVEITDTMTTEDVLKASLKHLAFL